MGPPAVRAWRSHSHTQLPDTLRSRQYTLPADTLGAQPCSGPGRRRTLDQGIREGSEGAVSQTDKKKSGSFNATFIKSPTLTAAMTGLVCATGGLRLRAAGAPWSLTQMAVPGACHLPGDTCACLRLFRSCQWPKHGNRAPINVRTPDRVRSLGDVDHQVVVPIQGIVPAACVAEHLPRDGAQDRVGGHLGRG